MTNALADGERRIRSARRALPIIVGLIGSSVLFFWLFAEPIFLSKTFIYRDAGHFYDPYFQLQVDEWSAGRIPLWNPHENGGEPLAGNPTASVFYPGKLIFAGPYDWAYRWYLLLHVALAGCGTYVAARGLGLAPAGACLAAVSYAFGGFVLFQVYNAVFLVGAAWLPLGLWATHQLVVRPTLWASLVLAVTLAMQILGGDPQVAQLTVLAGFVHALFHHCGFRTAFWILLPRFAFIGAAIVHLAGPAQQAVGTLIRTGSVAEAWLRLFEECSLPPLMMAALASLACLGTILLVLFSRLWLQASLWNLGLATILAGGLAAVQILPTMDFAARSVRSSPDVPLETAAFSLHPARLAELAFSRFYGRMFPENGRWFPWAATESVWVPSLYFGLVPALFAFGSLALWRGPSTEKWLSWLLLLFLLASFGKYGGLGWWTDQELFSARNPLNIERGERLHGDSDGLYWLLEQTVPGFRQFRYPAKLLVFVTLAGSLLGGAGLSQLIREPAGRRRFARVIALCLLAVASPFVGGVLYQPIRSTLESLRIPANTYGPFLLDLAMRDLSLSLILAMVGGGLVALAVIVVRQRPHWAGAAGWALVALLLVDLGISQRWLLLVDDDALRSDPGPVLSAIQEHAEQNGADPVYRIHRTRQYHPLWYRQVSSPDRVREQTRWERRTAQPKYAVRWGFDYAKTEGTMNYFDIDFFFAPWVVTTPAPLQTRGPGQPARMVYYPRQGYDLWNTRYFILPRLMVLDDVERGVFTLLFDRSGQPLPVLTESSPKEEDYVVLENVDALPRAWIVPTVDILPEIHHLRRKDRAERMEALMYRATDGGLPLWEGEVYPEYPFRQRAMVETNDPSPELVALSRASAPVSGSVTIDEYQADRVRLSTKSQTTGLLVLADAFDPGWHADVDGVPTEIIRTNRAQRGVVLPAGDHLVEFRYRSRPFEKGLIISLVSVVVTGVLIVVAWRQAPAE